MKVFVTGGTGFIGTAVVAELIKRGHKVVGLARSENSEKKLKNAGANVLRGSLDDLNVIAEGAEESDATIHLAFTNDFDDYSGAVNKDRKAIKTIGDAIKGTNKVFINTSGTLMVHDLGRTVTENDSSSDPTGRGESETLTLSYADQGVKAMAIRLAPTVHSEQRQGFGTILSQLAVQHNQTGYVQTGDNQWPFVHRDDAAVLYVDALEKGQAGHVYNAIAQEGIPFIEIVNLIGHTLNLPIENFKPDEAKQYFGWFYGAATTNNPTSSQLTQQELNWHPTHPELLTDMKTFLSDPKNVAQLKEQK